MKIRRMIHGLILFGVATSSAIADEPRPVISIQATHPDRQVQEVIRLFEGSRAPHPSAALAYWKRATHPSGHLGKPLEALIALFNPRMAEEFRSLDQAEAALWFEPKGGSLAWGLTIPGDDGTFSNLASAFVLSGGRVEPPDAGIPVDRLDGVGSPLMAQSGPTTWLAGDLEALRIVRARSARAIEPSLRDGIRFRVEPGALEDSKCLTVRRLAEVVRPTRGTIAGHVGLSGPTLKTTIELDHLEPIGGGTIDPAWLDGIPIDRALAGFAMSFNPSGQTRDAALALADRVERVDPARAGLAPLRLRLAVLARSVGVRLDYDLFPHWRGVSGWVDSSLGSGVLVVHLDEETSAHRLADRIRPEAEEATIAGEVRSLGRVQGREVRITWWDSSVAIGWGDGSIESSKAARLDPARSAGATLRSKWSTHPTAIAGGFWPGRWPGLNRKLASGLAESSPILLNATWTDPSTLRAEATWSGLDASVRRFLELIPLDPPPDR